MEIKAELLKPYTENERMDFIVQQNHKNGYEIRETETSLEAWGYTEEEQTQKEHERLDMLFLTSADVERGIYQAKGMDFDDIMAFVMANPPQGLDVKALKIELKANNFYRGNPYVNAVGALLGFTEEQLNKFFEFNDYTYLIPSEQIEEQDENTTDTTESDIQDELDTTTSKSDETNTDILE